MMSVKSTRISFVFGALLVLSGFTVIPYIGPYQVANIGISNQDLAWLYMVGGAATFFTRAGSGACPTKHGKQRVFTIIALLSMLPIVITTHFPRAPLLWVMPFSTLFFVLVSGRFVPRWR
jgi:predicted MFS family arabinose efflux permease